MKKKLFFCVLCGLLCFGFVFYGCSSNVLALSESRVSDMRSNYFEGQTASWYVSFSSGLRESPYTLDGVSENTVEFGVVTILGKSSQSSANLTYTVSINDLEYSGEFEASPFDDTYAGDICKNVSNADVIFITVSDGGSAETASMTCASCDFTVSAEQALELAVSEVQTELKTMSDSQSFEVYVKIVADITQAVPEKYWFVMFLSADGDSISVLINPETGECEIKKV